MRQWVSDNFVSVAFPGEISLRSYIEIVVANASRKIPIESLWKELEVRTVSRGGMAFGLAAEQIDTIARTCELGWWITERGLTIDQFSEESCLSRFDAVIGKLMAEYSTNGERLEKGILEVVARAADNEGFGLKAHLRRSYWDKLAQHNEHYPKRAIKTFQAAVENRSGRRGVQLCFYDARDRFLKAGGR